MEIHDLSIFLDKKGFPGTRDYTGMWDGGDTAAILGHVIALQKGEIFHPKMLNMLLSVDRQPRRHWNTEKWYGQPDRFSRDQLIPMICAGIRLHRYPAIDDIYLSHKRKLFLTAWNTKKNGAMNVPDKFPDICGPEIWALWIRYKCPKWGRLVLWLLDLETLVGSISWRWFRRDRVCRNHMLVCHMGLNYKPTWVMKLAHRLNDWGDLVKRWHDHCAAVGEYPTAELFPFLKSLDSNS